MIRFKFYLVVLKIIKGEVFAGHSGGRLPDMKELGFIVEIISPP